jgi:hypothetical protein
MASLLRKGHGFPSPNLPEETKKKKLNKMELITSSAQTKLRKVYSILKVDVLILTYSMQQSPS